MPDRPRRMAQSDRNQNTREQPPFSLMVDQYGRLWLSAKLEGMPVDIDLGEKDAAFEIMAASMAEHDFEEQPVSQDHQAADNDDQTGR